MFSKIVTSALFAGFCAGLIAALLQLVFVQPVLLHAELYEGGDLVHFGAAAVSAHPDLPGLDPVRDGLSLLFSALIYVGYALILVAAMGMAADRGHAINARNGLIWGIAGFVAFQFAPALSLPPEVPGVAAADVAERQIWWWATVAATAIALALIAFGRNWVLWTVAILLMLTPHLIGAPHPDELSGPVPPEIAALFAARALGVGFAAWALLGLFAGYFWQRESTAT
ncbi:MAG: cobalt transporter [Roseovarius sp. BRH_c41]|uniref:CbtA family protein n=1 Tax=Roseovarius sp. BRH_c41 TaxID=1629709 RepID=UPI0005F11A62|nr:CbtA family protein [Roseovarius sp. BRH_c41]KJS43022.1 MAG: cobalt transporter [Roseovarius sp. BRH_c41]